MRLQLRPGLAPGVAARDVIADFNGNTQDKIDLSNIDANADGGMANDVFAFMGTGPITGLGQIRFQRFNLAGTADDHTLIERHECGRHADRAYRPYHPRYRGFRSASLLSAAPSGGIGWRFPILMRLGDGLQKQVQGFS